MAKKSKTKEPKKSKKTDAQDFQSTWVGKIDRAKEIRKNWKELFRVDMLRDYIDGKQNPGYPTDEWLTINKIYSHLQAMLPTLYSIDPYFYVKLKKSYQIDPETMVLWDERGKVRQGYLNYLKSECDLKTEARLAIQDAQFAYGVIKTHYTADLKDNPDYEEKNEKSIEPEKIPVNERYNITRIHPDDFLVDDDAGPLERNWKWVAQRIRMTVEDAEKDKRYDKKVIDALKSKGESQDDEERARETRKKGDIKGRSEDVKRKPEDKQQDNIIAVWEIWDLQEKKWHCIAEEGEEPLFFNEDIPKGIEKHPFSILRFFLRDDSFYPHPPLSSMIDPQKEFNTVNSRIVTHGKRFNRKYEMDAQAFGDQVDNEAAKLTTGDDGTVLIKRNPTMGAAVIPIPDAPLDQSTHYMLLSFLEKCLIELGGGASDEARGIAGADSATQADIINRRMEIKEGDALSLVNDWLTKIAAKLDQLVKVNISRDEAVKIVGPSGAIWEFVRTEDYEDIQGEFEYSVNTGANMPRLPQLERAQWLSFLQTLSQMPQLMLAPTLMKRMAEMHHIEDEAMLKEMVDIGKQMMSGQIPLPGRGGTPAGGGKEEAGARMGGIAGGVKSLNLPGAGNFQQG
jgi:hypothetical protein